MFEKMCVESSRWWEGFTENNFANFSVAVEKSSPERSFPESVCRKVHKVFGQTYTSPAFPSERFSAKCHFRSKATRSIVYSSVRSCICWRRAIPNIA